MKYLVTGGAGFIGSHLIENLKDNDHEVICLDNFSSGLRSNIAHIKGITVIDASLELQDHISDIDGIFHLAAQASVPKSIDDFFESSSNNLLGTIKVFDWARKSNIPVVYASSSAIYGNLPLGDDSCEEFDILSPYAQDKLTMEHYASMAWKVYKTASIGLRFFNVYGPRQDPSNPYSGVISIFVDRMSKGLPLTVNGGYQTRDFVYVKDICDALARSMRLLHVKSVCEAMNVGTGVSITIDQLVEVLMDIMSVKPKIDRVALPAGDPEISGGTYTKMQNLLDTDLGNLTPFKIGIQDTVQNFLNTTS